MFTGLFEEEKIKLKGSFEEKTEIESMCHLNDVDLIIYQDEIIKRNWDGTPIVREVKSKGMKLYGSNGDTKIIVYITGDFKVSIQIDEK